MCKPQTNSRDIKFVSHKNGTEKNVFLLLKNKSKYSCLPLFFPESANFLYFDLVLIFSIYNLPFRDCP